MPLLLAAFASLPERLLVSSQQQPPGKQQHGLWLVTDLSLVD